MGYFRGFQEYSNCSLPLPLWSFGPKGLPASFRDTGNSIEEMAFQAKDSLLVVDDLYPAKNPKERTKLEGVLEYLLRNQGDRQGKGRLKSNSP